MATTTKKALTEVITPMFEQGLPALEIEEKIYNAKKGIVEPIQFGQALTELVKSTAIKLGFVLDGEGLDSKVKDALQSLEELPKSYISMLKLAQSMSEGVYNTVDEFIPYMKLNWSGSFPVESKTWNKNSFDFKTMELLIQNPELSEENFLTEIALLTRDTESGQEQLLSHRVQPNFKMAKKWVHMMQMFNEHLTQKEIENLLTE